MHAGLMSLATSQASAMRDFGTRIDDRFVQIDQSVLAQNEKLKQIDGALGSLRDDMRSGFVRISEQMSGLDEKLDRIEARVTNPEETRAWERFRRAADLIKNGHPADALEHLNAAIENDGGPAFRHIPQFQLMLGQIRIGDTISRDPVLVDYDAAHRAFRQASLHLKGQHSAIALCRAGVASFLDGDLDCAIDTYLDALKIPHPIQYTHFEISKCYLEKGQLNDMAHHLRHAVDQDWNMIALVASDPVFLKEADIVEGVLKKYRDSVLNIIQPGLKAIEHVAGGSTAGDYLSMRSSLNKLAEDVTLDKLDADLKVKHKPCFTHREVGMWDEGDFQNLYAVDREILSALIADDAGLIDIQKAFKSSTFKARSGTKETNSFLGFIQKQFAAAKRHSYEISTDLNLCRATSFDKYISSTLLTGIEITKEATSLAQLRGGVKPGILGRIAGRKEARSMDELNAVLRSENRRLSAKVVEAVQPAVESVSQSLHRSDDIIRSAQRTYAMIQAYLESDFQFLKPSPSTQAESAENSLSPAPS